MTDAVDTSTKMGFLIQQVDVRSWNGFVKICNALSDNQNRWVFRGQADSEWPLATTFEREALSCGHSPAVWDALEKLLVNEFKRGGHRYLDHLPTNEIQWLALMQHYGAPTRLLDFTKSPYIAAYHALNGPLGKRFAIFAVHREKIERSISKMWMRNYDYQLGDSELLCDHTLRGSAISVKPHVLPIQPSLTHERLANQQGLFLMQDSINSRFEDRMHSFVETIEVVEDDSFMSVSAKQVEDGIWKRLKSVCDARWNMKETFGFGLPRYLVAQGSVLIKITIPSAVRSDFMGYLDDMNINEQSLFPGLDGYARHMKRLIARWSVNNKWGAHYRQLK